MVGVSSRMKGISEAFDFRKLKIRFLLLQQSDANCATLEKLEMREPFISCNGCVSSRAPTSVVPHAERWPRRDADSRVISGMRTVVAS